MHRMFSARVAELSVSVTGAAGCAEAQLQSGWSGGVARGTVPEWQSGLSCTQLGSISSPIWAEVAGEQRRTETRQQQASVDRCKRNKSKSNRQTPVCDWLVPRLHPRLVTVTKQQSPKKIKTYFATSLTIFTLFTLFLPTVSLPQQLLEED